MTAPNDGDQNPLVDLKGCLGCLTMIAATAVTVVMCSWLLRLAWTFWPWK